MFCNVLAAEYTAGSKTRSALLDINRIVDGHRTNLATFRVVSRREAREIAKRFRAEPWNF